jgi:L-lactate dehydrogenase complex protein LldG
LVAGPVNAREVILARVAAAVADVPTDEPAAWSLDQDPDPAAAFIRRRTAEPGALAALFTERCAEYRATVTRCVDEPGAIAGVVEAACERHGARVLAIPAGLDPGWRPGGRELRSDEPSLPLADLDACDGVITGCACAIALTGTIVLDGGPGQGRRATSLVPDLHICVVRAAQVVAGVPDAFALLDASLRMGRPITFISGPSATSDIELQRVEGVHGPRRLEVVVAG